MKNYTLFFMLLLTTCNLFAGKIIKYQAYNKLEITDEKKKYGLYVKSINSYLIGHTFSDGVGILTFEDEITSIGEYAFYSTNIKSITIPESVTIIGEKAFADCSSLQSIILPERLTTIGDYAFEDCKQLRSIVIPNSVKNFGRCVFWSCENLYSVTLPQSIKTLDGTFAFCRSLSSIKLPSGITSIGGSCFFDCVFLREIVLPDGIRNIGKHAFFNCNRLTKINIPEKTETIGKAAFADCKNLTSINIPDNVKEIGENAFSGCKDLTIHITPCYKQYFRDMPALSALPVVADIQSSCKNESSKEGNEDREPKFPGGEAALRNFIATNLSYPAEAQANGIQGKVIIRFKIDEKGYVRDIEIVKSGGDPSLDKEALRLIRSMPQWEPGYSNGKAASFIKTIPLNFKLQ